MTSVAELRMGCLGLAAKSAGAPDEVLRLAERYYQWVVSVAFDDEGQPLSMDELLGALPIAA